MIEKRQCILCGVLTYGSVGAAGITWLMICQTCKDIEDGALLHNIQAQAKTNKLLMEAMQ